MAWGDTYRYQARDQDAQARRLDEEAVRLEAEADRLEAQRRAEFTALDGLPPSLRREIPPMILAPSVPTARTQSIGSAATAPSTVSMAPNARGAANQRTMQYLAQAKDPEYDELASVADRPIEGRAPGIRRMVFLARSIPVAVAFVFLPQIVPALPAPILTALGHALATVIVAAALVLAWLAWAVLPRLRNCMLPMWVSLGVFMPYVGLAIAVLCLVMPERKSQR